jgi:hypothetical protein
MLTALELEFADGEYTFDLKLPQLAELQEKRGCGIFKLYGRVVQGRYIFEGQTIASTVEGEAYAEDLFEVVRLALIGGNAGVVSGEEIKVSANLARKLVERYCHDAPLKEAWAIAAAVLGARIEGYDPPKKAKPVDEPATDLTAST